MYEKKPALLAEDGAQFYGHIRKTEDGGYYASCHAENDLRSHVVTESGDGMLFEEFEAARKWINEQAARRGFPKVIYRDGEPKP